MPPNALLRSLGLLQSNLAMSLFLHYTGHGEGRLGCPSVKGSEVWCLRTLYPPEVWSFLGATLPCLFSIDRVDGTPFGGAFHAQPGTLKVSAVASVAQWICT